MKDKNSLIFILLLSLSAWAQHEQHPMPPASGQQQATPQGLEQQPAQAPVTAAPPKQTEVVIKSRLQTERARGLKLSLAQLEEMALSKNPTLAQAQAEIRGAEGRRRQAGLWPNPTIGYSGEEIRGGSLGGGQHGAFIEQDIVLGSKLRLGKEVFAQERQIAEIEAEEQRLRVTNAVKLGFYQVLASQELLNVRLDLARVVADQLLTSRRLRNLGQVDESEVLMANVEAQRAKLALQRQENQFRRDWTALMAVIGDPSVPIGTVEGNLDKDLPVLDEGEFLRTLLSQSPAVSIARVNVMRNEAELARSRRVPIPNLRLRGGLQQNQEMIESSGRRVGLQGFAEIGVQVPLFNRNQGNVEAAAADVERSRQELRRVELILRERAEALLESHRNAREAVEAYKSEILPSAKGAYELMLKQWAQMGTSYLQLVLAQRSSVEVQTEYLQALQELWTTSVAMKGFLLTDGLEAPARPGEVDLPVRELNIPTSRMSGGQQRD